MTRPPGPGRARAARRPPVASAEREQAAREAEYQAASRRRAALEAAHGKPRHVDTAVALRRAGLREHVHPRDAYAFAYRDADAAHAWQQATLDHHGVGHFGTYATGEGPEVVIGI